MEKSVWTEGASLTSVQLADLGARYGADPARIGASKRRFSCDGRLAGSAMERRTGRIGRGAAAGLEWTSGCGFCKKVARIRPMLVVRSALSGIAGHYSGHPLRTRSVLTDAAGTVRAVFLWPVNVCSAVAAVSRFGQPGRAGDRTRSLGFPRSRCDPRPFGPSPVLVSRGVLRPTAPAGFLPAVALDRTLAGLSRIGQPGLLSKIALASRAPRLKAGMPWSPVADPGV